MSALLLRISGWFLLFGGLLMAVTNFHLPMSPVAAALINLLGGVLLLLGLPALYARQAPRMRWIGLVGLIISGARLSTQARLQPLRGRHGHYLPWQECSLHWLAWRGAVLAQSTRH